MEEDGIRSRRKKLQLLTILQHLANSSPSMPSLKPATGIRKCIVMHCTISVVSCLVTCSLTRDKGLPSSLGLPPKMIGGKEMLMERQEFSQPIMSPYKTPLLYIVYCLFCIVYMNNVFTVNNCLLKFHSNNPQSLFCTYVMTVLVRYESQLACIHPCIL